MRVRTYSRWVSLVLLLVIGPNIAAAQEVLPSTKSIAIQAELKANRSVVERKLSPVLRKAYQRTGAGLTFSVLKSTPFTDPLLVVNEEGKVQVYIAVTSTDATTRAALERLGVEIELINEELRLVQGFISLNAIDTLATSALVLKIRTPDYRAPMSGVVTSEGDVALRAEEVRTAIGVDGKGVKVGVISDGVDNWKDARFTGDLPDVIEVNPSLKGNGDEGTAMLEIVHDLAPGAHLAFSGPETSLEMISSIEYLAFNAFGGSGADIIVDDLAFMGEPFFEDGPIARTVDRVVREGTTYFTSAGNQADRHYSARFRPKMDSVSVLHNFGTAAGRSSDISMDVLIPPGGTFIAILQWDDRFGASGNDYDLFLFDDSLKTLITESSDEQSGDGDPIEFFGVRNDSTASAIVKLVIGQVHSRRENMLKMHFIGQYRLLEYNTRESSIAPGQASSKSAISVGAIDVADRNHDQIESYSSRGPAVISYPNSETRMKPDLVAMDGNLITGSGGFGSKLGGKARFFGTSAASPHAAAVAALLLSADPSLTPSDIRRILTDTAVDLGDSGNDNTYGSGRIDAFEAVSSVSPNRPPLVVTPIEDQILTEPGAVFRHDLNTTFEDPDGSALFFTVTSSDPAIALAEIEGTELVVTAVKGGETVILVEAVDIRGGKAELSFSVLVNTAPFVAREISDRLMTIGRDVVIVGLDTIITDPEGEVLTFTASSSDAEIARVALATHILNVYPVSGGEATIKVQGVDRGGAIAETDFNVLVNTPPLVTEQIADTLITAGQAPLYVDLDPVFNDPDGDSLQYTVSSSDPDVATAEMEGMLLVINGKATGETRIQIQAIDGKRGSIETTFLVEVNAPPYIVRTIADTVLTIGENPIGILLDTVFTDVDDEELSYSVSNSDKDIVEANLDVSSLTVRAIKSGSSIIRVQVEDVHGGISHTQFTIQVNTPPVALVALQDLSLNIGSMPFSARLDSVFMDPDGETLHYRSSVSDESVAEVEIEAGFLTVKPVSGGSVTVTVEARDARNTSISQSFTITVNTPPVVSRISRPDVAVKAGEALLIQAGIEDDLGVGDVVLYYRLGGESVIRQLTMNEIGSGNYSAVIPSSDLTPRGVTYHVEVLDRAGLLARSEEQVAVVRLEGRGLHKQAPQPVGNEQESYRLVSLPILLDDPSIHSTLEDDLGPYDKKSWRLFDLGPDRRYVEVTDTMQLRSGRAYWLIVKEGEHTLTSGPGVAASAFDRYTIPLRPGWNLIGSPYSFSIEREKITLTSLEDLDVRTYDGSWRIHTDTFEPFEGYAVFSSSEDTLIIDPDRDLTSKSKNQSTPEAVLDWWVQIEGRSQRAVDTDNYLGVSNAAVNEWDQLDKPEPPPIGGYVSVSFPHPEWEHPGSTYSVDIRSPVNDGQVWPVDIRSNTGDMVHLAFKGIDQLPSGWQAWLYDPVLNNRQELQVTPNYDLVASEEGRRLELVIGTLEFITNSLQGKGELPTDLVLDQNFPNPFNPATTIRFGLPEDAVVSIKIYNVLGEEVATLIKGEQRKAGYHTILWSGTNAAGQLVASGVYFYRLDLGARSIVKKMILAK